MCYEKSTWLMIVKIIPKYFRLPVGLGPVSVTRGKEISSVMKTGENVVIVVLILL